jgi:hypothetical protein
LDLLYVLGIRLGLEMTRKFLTTPMLVLMGAFSIVHAPEPDPSVSESVSPGMLEAGDADDWQFSSYLSIM